MEGMGLPLPLLDGWQVLRLHLAAWVPGSELHCTSHTLACEDREFWMPAGSLTCSFCPITSRRKLGAHLRVVQLGVCVSDNSAGA